LITQSQLQTIGCSIKARPLATPGISSINLVVIIDRKPERIPLQIQWPTDKFDQLSGKLLPRHSNDKECIQNNLIIDKFLATANNLRLQYYAYGKKISVKEFKSSFINYASRENIIDYIEMKIKTLHEQNLISDQSRKLHKTSLNILVSFRSRDQWTFDGISTQDIKAFQHWMLKQGKVSYNNGRKQLVGYAYNTTVGHLKFLKKFLALAQADKISFESPFKNFSIPQYEPGHREVLTKDEVSILQGLRSSPKLSEHEKEVLDRYLIGCFTGLRKSDIEALNPKKHIRNGRLLMKPTKTVDFGTEVEFKIPQQALDILKDYGVNGFGFMHDSLLNKTLKKVISMAGISKYIKFHSSRDCFAVLYLKFGGNLGDLKDLMGHKKISTTEIYLKMGSDAKNDIMSMFDKI